MAGVNRRYIVSEWAYEGAFELSRGQREIPSVIKRDMYDGT